MLNKLNGVTKLNDVTWDAVRQSRTQRNTVAFCMIVTSLLIIVSTSVDVVAQTKRSVEAENNATAINTLTAAERRDNWKLLFDGKTTAGWRGYHRDVFPAGRWVVQDGCLHHLAGGGDQSRDGGDIITTGQYANFELSLEWKLAPGGNSGIKYFIDERLPPLAGSSIYSGVGFEMQILDDERHPDAKMGRGGNRTAGSLYDLIAAPQSKILKPVGEFNLARLVVNGAHVEHWLNNLKVVEYELGSREIKALIAASKYKDTPQFGTRRRGHILFQDHGDAVWFRNIKIRELKSAPTTMQTTTRTSSFTTTAALR